jgi:DNA-binding transcriptional LysR family regulator
VFNAIDMIVEGSLAGLGLSYQPRMIVQDHLDAGRLVQILSDWSSALPGYHLYYPSRRQPTPAFTLFVNALRYRG